MFDKSHEYHTISVLRSALSSVQEKIDGFRVGSHPDVCLLLKGISTQRPPKPKYSSCIWNVSEVLTYKKNMGENEHLSLKQLELKTCFLIAITCQGARFEFWGMAGSEDFACATLPLDFQGKV